MGIISALSSDIIWFEPQGTWETKAIFAFLHLLLHSTITNHLEASQCLCVRCIRSRLLSTVFFLPITDFHCGKLSHSLVKLHTVHHTILLVHTCNYPFWWLMECFQGWVGKQLELSCWGLYIITQSLNMPQCEDNLRMATCQWLVVVFVPPGCWSKLLWSCYVASKKVTGG